MNNSTFNSTKVAVLLVLCFQNSLFTLVRRYSQGVLKETYSKHEVLLFGEVVKMAFSALMIYQGANENRERNLKRHFHHLMATANKMVRTTVMESPISFLFVILIFPQNILHSISNLVPTCTDLWLNEYSILCSFTEHKCELVYNLCTT